jgi:hypothetical protein
LAASIAAEKLDQTSVDRKWRGTRVADNSRQIGCALMLAAILGSCTGADIENAALGAAKSWCRLHSPQYCSVDVERPYLQ